MTDSDTDPYADPYTDAARLTGDAYADPSDLEQRLQIYQYRRPRLDFAEFVRDLVSWRGDERVIDVGAGSGRTVAVLRTSYPSLRPVLADLSLGMARRAASACDAPAVVADAQALPFASRSAEIVLALHMLYHVPDMNAAVAELARVVTLGGTVLVSCNSRDNLREVKALFAEGLAAVHGRPVAIPPGTDERFNLESGADLLEQRFDQVRRKASWGTLSIPSSAPVVAYVQSMRPLRGDLAAGEGEWDAVIAYIARRVDEIIEATGVFEVTARAGVFVCR